MVTNERNIGKVSISCDGAWDIRKDYDKLCLVTDGSYNYISRKQVPNGTDITNEEYWQKFDNQRKAAIKSALPAEKYQKFEETVKEIQFKGRE